LPWISASMPAVSPSSPSFALWIMKSRSAPPCTCRSCNANKRESPPCHKATAVKAHAGCVCGERERVERKRKERARAREREKEKERGREREREIERARERGGRERKRASERASERPASHTSHTETCISVQRRCLMSPMSCGRCMGVAVKPASPAPHRVTDTEERERECKRRERD
jgi:hypothetical protein